MDLTIEIELETDGRWLVQLPANSFPPPGLRRLEFVCALTTWKQVRLFDGLKAIHHGRGRRTHRDFAASCVLWSLDRSNSRLAPRVDGYPDGKAGDAAAIRTSAQVHFLRVAQAAAHRQRPEVGSFPCDGCKVCAQGGSRRNERADGVCARRPCRYGAGLPAPVRQVPI